MHSQNSWRASNRKLRAGTLFTLALSLGAGASAMAADPNAGEHVAIPYNQEAAAKQLAGARFLGHQNPQTPVDLVFMLPLRDQSGLDTLLHRLYDPHDPLFRQYLTSQQFAERFGPTQADYDAVIQYAESIGMTVVSKSSSRTLLRVRGTTDTVENALGLRFNRYLMPDSRVSYSAEGLPSIPKSIASRITGITGLNNLSERHHHHVKMNSLVGSIKPIISHAGNGPAGGFSPLDVQTAYNVPKGVQGEGQSVALYELDGYHATDITAFTTQFGLPAAHLVNVPIDGYDFSIQDTGGETEVVLDIDMVLTMAPKIGTLYVYGAENGGQGVLDEWQRIADDNVASVISTSWGFPETLLGSGEAATENGIFAQLKAQGQSIFDASGDNGAFDIGGTSTALVVDDPAGQPFVTGVGGTTLKLGAGSIYGSEAAWSGSGGGISTIWPKPDYQTGFQGSTATTPTTFREVPDVSLNADPNTGYDIFVNDDNGWLSVGGTSAAAPLWAGFTALINQGLATGGSKPIGFINPSLYGIAGNATAYAKAFHDITTGGNGNAPYNAKAGFDDSTGLGTFNAGEMFTQLALPANELPATITGTVTDSTGQPITTGTPAVGAVTVTATVTATHDVAASTTTDATGKYTLHLLTGVTYTLVFTADGFAGPDIPNLLIPIVNNAGGTLTENETMGTSFTYAAGFQMISAPFEFGAIADFSTVFGLADDPPAGLDPVLFAFDPTQNKYLRTPSAPADTLHNGHGYWIKLATATSIHRLGVAPPNQAFRILLQKGWNIIGDPFNADVTIGNIKVDGVTATKNPKPISGTTTAQLPLYTWGTTNNAQTGYTKLNSTTQVIQPYVGYWIYASDPCTLVISPP